MKNTQIDLSPAELFLVTALVGNTCHLNCLDLYRKLLQRAEETLGKKVELDFFVNATEKSIKCSKEFINKLDSLQNGKVRKTDNNFKYQLRAHNGAFLPKNLIYFTYPRSGQISAPLVERWVIVDENTLPGYVAGECVDIQNGKKLGYKTFLKSKINYQVKPITQSLINSYKKIVDILDVKFDWKKLRKL